MARAGRRFGQNAYDIPHPARPLEQDEVERGRLARDCGEQAVNLTAVVGLVVEEMDESRSERLFEIHRVRDRTIAQEAGEIRVGQSLHVGDDARVLGLPRRSQLLEILEQDRVEPIGRVALCGKAAHPDAIGDEEVVQACRGPT